MNSPEGFLGNARTMELFFRYCMRYKITSQKDKIEVLRRMTAKKKMKYIRDPKEFIKGKRVIKFD